MGRLTEARMPLSLLKFYLNVESVELKLNLRVESEVLSEAYLNGPTSEASLLNVATALNISTS